MRVVACLVLCALAACAAPLRTYSPTQNEAAIYNQGVGAVTWQSDDAVLTMYPTFRYQSAADIPTFTLMVQNRSNHNIDFVPENITAFIDNRQWHVYTLPERVAEIRRVARHRQIALAIAGGLAAASAGYAASHQTTTVNTTGFANGRPFFASGTIQTYDPAAGMLAGAAVGAGTGVGIQQIARTAGYEERAAQAIFQHTTIAPNATIVGQVIIKAASQQFGVLRFVVPVEQAQATFEFKQASIAD